MRLGGYFPLRTERERFELRVNAGFFDDLSDTVSDAFGGSDDRGAFESGQTVQIDDRSFQSPGTTGGAIPGDSEFRRAKSGFEQGFGTAAATGIGFLSGVPGAGNLLRSLTSRPTFAVDAAGNRLTDQQFVGGGGSAGGNDIASLLAQTGSARIGGGGSNIAVTFNEQGELIDNAGNVVNQQGQRLDAQGRVMSEADIAIQQALGFTEAAATGAAGELRGGADTAINRARTGAIRGRDFLQGAETRGQEFLTGGAGRAQGFLQTQADLGIGGIEEQLGITQGRLDPFTQAGTRALGQEEAFLGLSGPEAQQAALQGFTETPGQAFLREQQEQALLRGSAAVGGLGGGRVREALQEQAFGRATTRLDDQLNRLSQLSGRGQQSATQQGQFGQQAATNIADIRSQLGGRQAGIETDLAARQTGLTTGTAANLANIADTLAGREVGIATGTSGGLADILLRQGEQQGGAVLQQEAVRTGERSQANQLAAKQDLADQQFQRDLLGLGVQAFQPQISSFLGGLF